MKRFTTIGWIGFGWGIVGVSLLLLFAVARLTPVALEALSTAPGPKEVAAIGASLVFFGYVEGYRAFQRQFSPRVVARALAIAKRPRWPFVALAPAFCMGFFHATRKRQIVAWTVTALIVVLVVLVSRLDQPWRGIIDLGVAVALSWGIGATLVFAALAVAGRSPRIDADLPATKAIP